MISNVSEQAAGPLVKAAGLMRFVGNAEIEQQRSEEMQAQRDQNRPVILNLASHVRQKWNAARDAKNDIEKQMHDDLRQRKGEYSSEDLAKIQAQGGSEVFINITNVKCRAAESWLYDIQLPPGERPWSAGPTPVPELPQQIEKYLEQRVTMQFQEAMMANVELGAMTSQMEVQEQINKVKDDVLKEIRDRAEKDSKNIEDNIDDELVQGGWYQAVRDIISDIVTLPAGIVHGPTISMEKQMEWSEYPDGTPYVQVVEKPTRKYSRISPFDIYPSPGARNFQDGYLCHLIRFERSGLLKLIGVEGFNEFAIRQVLRDFGAGGLREWASYDTERYDLENRPSEFGSNKAETIDCIKYMGPVQGLMLRQWGMTEEEVPDPLMDYQVTAYLIDNYIIGAKLNDHPLGKRNYYSASFDASNDSPWGKGIPELMRDIQKICNGCARALVNNMAHGSGPMVWLDMRRLADGEQVAGITPWKIWRMYSKAGDNSNQPPVGFFQPASIVEHLLKVYEYFFKQASEVTGIPAYIYGSPKIGGAGETASGLSMLMNAASKGLKAVAAHIDNGIIKPSIEEHWLNIMLYEPEKAIGDVKIVARASEYLIMMEQLQIRRMEFLNTTANPIDMQIIGQAGRAMVLRETVKSLKMPIDKIVPDRESIMQNMDQTMMQLVIQRIAAGLGMPTESIAQLAQGGGAGKPNVSPEQQAALLPSGEQAGGRESRMM